MQNLLPSLLAVIVGGALIVQIGLNAQIRGALGSVSIAAIVNFIVGLLALIGLAAVTTSRWPGAADFAAVPRAAWLSGLLGALYVAASTVLGPRLGATLFLALIVLGQMIASLLLDHYGVLSFAEQPVSAQRVFGVILLVAGVVLISRA